MSIQYYEQSKTFHLVNNHISYIIKVMENGQLEHVYYGAKIGEKVEYNYLHEEYQRADHSVCVPEPGLLSMHYAAQEYPSYGTSDYRSPAFYILQENGSRICDFQFKSYKIVDGKPDILPLPATYVDEEKRGSDTTYNIMG